MVYTVFADGGDMAGTGIVREALDRLRAKKQRSDCLDGSESKHFVANEDLKEVWNQDYIKHFFHELDAKLSDDECAFIQNSSLKSLSVLVAMEWKDWLKAKNWLTTENGPLIDSALPLSEDSGKRFEKLSDSDVTLFMFYQPEYDPVVIKETEKLEEISSERRLPIKKVEEGLIGHGAYGEVSEISIARRQFEDSKGFRNEVRPNTVSRLVCLLTKAMPETPNLCVEEAVSATKR
jgi:hypothetical protein